MGRPPRPHPHTNPAITAFAEELKKLRKAAGRDAPSPARIAKKYKLGKSTIYHALQGSRLPEEYALRAMVIAWGGNVEDWLRRRESIWTGTSRPIEMGVLIRRADRDRWRRKIARRDYDTARAEGREHRSYIREVEHEYMDEVLDFEINYEIVAEEKQKLADDLTRIREQAGSLAIREIARRIEQATGEPVAPNTVKNLLERPYRATWPTLHRYLVALVPGITSTELERWRLRLAWMTQPHMTLTTA